MFPSHSHHGCRNMNILPNACTSPMPYFCQMQNIGRDFASDSHNEFGCTNSCSCRKRYKCRAPVLQANSSPSYRGHTHHHPRTHIFHPDFVQNAHSTNDLCLEKQKIIWKCIFQHCSLFFPLAETVGLIPSKFTACPV